MDYLIKEVVNSAWEDFINYLGILFTRVYKNSNLGLQVSLTEVSLEGIAEKIKRVPGASSELLLLLGQ